MKIIGTKTVFQGEYLKVKETHFISESGVKGTWEYIEKGSGIPFVVIFALTRDKEVLLEKIYRVPFQEQVLELPSGMNDMEGESEVKAAKRELFEETGYQAKTIIPVFKCSVSPATSTHEGSFYFAPDVEYVGGNRTDEVEEIEVIKVPLKELVNYVQEQGKNMKISDRILAIVPILQVKGLIKL
ncbi:NUDIX hydrolase [Candidatus Parcubacteria bacterium]|nr:NUDIX hydrolase [Candidatus Parcubacteria bacterium]